MMIALLPGNENGSAMERDSGIGDDDDAFNCEENSNNDDNSAVW